jgi:hypothetical protein
MRPAEKFNFLKLKTMRFAKIGEEVLSRHAELTGEELRLYMFIVFHTFIDTGICRRSITEISRIHGLIRNHSSERYKSLRKKGWCKNDRGGIRPLVGFNSPKIGLSEVQKTDYESPKNGLPASKNRTYETVNSPKNGLSSIPYIEPLNKEPYIEPLTQQRESKKLNGHNSIFSREECLKYVSILKSEGATINNPNAYAMKLYKSGESDAFIQAKLYPETPENQPESDARREALQMLLDVHRSGEDVAEYKHWYAEEDWRWLMTELAKSGNS